MSIRPATSDNLGVKPCLDPVALGRVMDRLCEGHAPTLRQRVVKTLGNLRRKMAMRWPGDFAAKH